MDLRGLRKLHSLSASRPHSTQSPPPLAHQLLDVFSQPTHLRDPSLLLSLSQLLTPTTVEYVIKRLPKWNQSHQFFLWASSSSSFRHTRYTYTALAGVLSRARRASLLKSLADDLLARRCPVTPGSLGFLIRCLGSACLADEAELVFDRAASHLNCVPNSYTHNCLLEALAKAGRVESLESRLRSVPEPDKCTLTSVLQCYCNVRKFDRATDVFDLMMDRGWVDEHVFTILAVGFCKFGEVDRACELVRKMEAYGTKPSEKMLVVLIHGFARRGRVDKSLEMLETMKGLGLKGDLSLYIVIIEGLCERKEVGRAMELYLEMKRDGISPDVTVIKKMISAMCGEGDLVMANQLLEEYGEKFDARCVVSLYNAVLDGLVKLGEVERAHMLLREMMESKDLETSQVRVDQHESGKLFRVNRSIDPNVASFNFVLNGLCKTKELDKALILLNDMVGMGCKGNLLTYNNLISELCYVDRLDDSYELLKTMKGFGVTPTEFTYNSIFYCLCRRGNLSAASGLLKEMRFEGHVPWIKHCTTMVQGLCQNGRVTEASGFLDEMVSIGFLPDMVAYSAAIDGMCKVGAVDEALKLFRSMSSNCYLPDVVAHNILINGFCKAGRLTAAQEIFNEMLKKGLVPSVVTYNSMIDGWCKAGKFDEALACFAAMSGDERSPTVVSYTSLIDGLCSAGRAEDALEYWTDMREKGCHPNKICYMALVHGLCKCGKVDTALLYFDEMKERGFEPDTFVYLLLINSLILGGETSRALEILKEVVQKYNFPNPEEKNYRFMRKAASRLYENIRTLDMKILVAHSKLTDNYSLRVRPTTLNQAFLLGDQRLLPVLQGMSYAIMAQYIRRKEPRENLRASWEDEHS